MTEYGGKPTFCAYQEILCSPKWRAGSITMIGLTVSLGFSLTPHEQYSTTAQLPVQ